MKVFIKMTEEKPNDDVMYMEFLNLYGIFMTEHPESEPDNRIFDVIPNGVYDEDELMESFLRNEPEIISVNSLGLEGNCYGVTNEEMLYGAAMLFNPKPFRELAEKLDGNLYVVPSSIHELIVGPEKDIDDPEKLLNLIKEINMQIAETNPNIVLTNSLYLYDRIEDTMFEVEIEETPEELQDVITEIYTEQKAGNFAVCPRCGKEMESELLHNSLSRHCKLYICPDCGMNEAFEDFSGEELPLKKWVMIALRVKCDKYRKFPESYEIVNRWSKEKHNVKIYKGNYLDNGNLALQLISDDGPYATLTINLNEKLPANMAYLDTNNFPEGLRLLRENNIGVYGNDTVKSGFCEYPVWVFSEEELASFPEL